MFRYVNSEHSYFVCFCWFQIEFIWICLVKSFQLQMFASNSSVFTMVESDERVHC